MQRDRAKIVHPTRTVPVAGSKNDAAFETAFQRDNESLE
jgi:hypothetical protein